MSYKANGTDIFDNVQVQDASVRQREKFVCSCGATRFSWVASNGEIKAGGFVADEYLYKCIGCGKQYSEKDIRLFFSK